MPIGFLSQGFFPGGFWQKPPKYLLCYFASALVMLLYYCCYYELVACSTIVVIMSWWRAQHPGTQCGHVIAEGWVHAREHVRELAILITKRARACAVFKHKHSSSSTFRVNWQRCTGLMLDKNLATRWGIQWGSDGPSV